MSHYKVAVFTKENGPDVDELLAPYDENIRVERYLDKTKAELIADGKAEIERCKNGKYAEYLKDPEKYLRETCHGCRDDSHFKFLSEEFPERLKWTDEEIYQHQIQYYDAEDIDEDGNTYSTYNPKSKWDWYSFGGRFSGELLLKPQYALEGHEDELCWVDEAFAYEVDFDKMRDLELENCKPYQEFIEGQCKFYKKEFVLERYPDEAAYKKQISTFSTYAVVTPDGEWHAPGEMGWWACSTETEEEYRQWVNDYYKAFLEPAMLKGWFITIVDCHI